MLTFVVFVGLRVLPGRAGKAPGQTTKSHLFFHIVFFDGFWMVVASILDDLFDDFRMFFASLFRHLFFVFF